MKHIDVYRLFVDKDIMNLTVIETNRQALRIKSNWTSVIPKEVNTFLWLEKYLRLMKYPKVHDYWSKKTFYKNDFMSDKNSRNQFTNIIRFIDFADNKAASPMIGYLRLSYYHNSVRKSYTNVLGNMLPSMNQQYFLEDDLLLNNIGIQNPLNMVYSYLNYMILKHIPIAS